MNRLTLAISAAGLLIAGAAMANARDRIVAPVNVVYTDERDNMLVSTWTDPDTGCDYLIHGDTMAPRLSRAGVPMCRDL